ncbi:hypothetical protein BJ170DRAFT_635117 [Xylariales sp. AK1849]|nr:hypothetical protein BJ170DRAFT_635117 [Xylariales sp. AK1849]
MKLIVTGATGFVGTELIRQSLRMRQITSVVALARKPVELEDGTDISKLKSVIIKDYGEYSEEVKKEFAGADACIWTVAITPSKARSQDFAEVKRICQDCTMIGLKAMHEAGLAKPFRFLYTSGVAAERDPNKTPSWMAQYALMRGATENQVLAFAADYKGEVEACVAKPGLILVNNNLWRSTMATALKYTVGVPSISVPEISAAMLQQVLDGFEKEPLENADLVRIGHAALATQ